MTSQSVDLLCDEADDLAGLYVLNALEPAEEDAVTRHLATCIQPHPLFAEVGGAATALMATVEPIEPPAELRLRVLGAIAATPQVTDATLGLQAPAAVVVAPLLVKPAEPISLAAARERRASRLSGTWRTVLAAAAVLLIVVLGASTLVFQRQASDSQARADTLSAAIAASLDPNSSTASFKGSGVAAAATGFAAFPQNGNGYLVIRGLPAVPAGKTYEAWFLAGTTPYPSVLLTVGADGLAIVKDLPIRPGSDAMALTIEPAGGSQAPTSAPIVVGKMQAGPVASATVLLAAAAIR